MKKTFLVIVMAIAALVSCKKSQPCIDFLSFTITELNGTILPGWEDRQPTIAFDGTRLNATVGGNQISAIYEAKPDGTLILSESCSTKMAVPDEIREDEFIEALNNVTSYSYEGNDLCLYDADGKLLIKAVN